MPGNRFLVPTIMVVFHLGFGPPAESQPAPTSFVHRTLTCGEFVAQADTRLSGPNNDIESQGLSQVIRLTDLSGHYLTTLPIFPKWSRNLKLHGRKVLDGLVWGWQCLTARTGQNYLMLEWSCHNPDSRTCEAAMDMQDEWYAIYDIHGHRLPEDPRGITEHDRRQIRKLGLWEDFMQSNRQNNEGVTYFYNQ